MMAIPKDALIEQRVGYRIFKERTRRGLTAMVLADRAGIHRNTVYRIESGLGISVVALCRIAAALEVTLDALVPISQCVVHRSVDDVSKARKAARVNNGSTPQASLGCSAQ